MSATTRFVIVATGRSGSTLLVDLLRSHPAIACDDELLNEQYWRHLRRPLLWLVRACPQPYLARRARRTAKPTYGFKIKTGGQVYSLGGTLQALYRGGWRIIHLHRSNALKQTFSWSVAKVSGRWQRTADQRQTHEAVHVDATLFMQDLQTCLRDRQTLATIVARLPHLSLIYEEHLQSSEQWTTTCEAVCDWLRVSPAPLSNRIVKTWDRPYAEVISNYAEIVAAVAHSPFHSLMEESTEVQPVTPGDRQI